MNVVAGRTRLLVISGHGWRVIGEGFPVNRGCCAQPATPILANGMVNSSVFTCQQVRSALMQGVIWSISKQVVKITNHSPLQGRYNENVPCGNVPHGV